MLGMCLFIIFNNLNVSVEHYLFVCRIFHNGFIGKSVTNLAQALQTDFMIWTRQYCHKNMYLTVLILMPDQICNDSCTVRCSLSVSVNQTSD